MANKLVLLIGFFSIISCASAKESTRVLPTIDDIQSLPLNSEEESIYKKIGDPNSKAQINGELISLYLTVEGYDQISLTFDGKKKLISKLYNYSPSGDLKSIFNKFGFKNLKKMNFPQCGFDFIRPETLFFDENLGVLVLAREDRSKVLTVTWTTHERVRNNIDDVRSCKSYHRLKNGSEERN